MRKFPAASSAAGLVADLERLAAGQPPAHNGLVTAEAARLQDRLASS